LKAHIAADLVYHETHCYLTEKRPGAWLDRLDDLEKFCQGKVLTLYPGHGAPREPRAIIDGTRSYLKEFMDALSLADGKAVEERMLKQFPNHHAKQFLTTFTIPAYFPPK